MHWQWLRYFNVADNINQFCECNLVLSSSLFATVIHQHWNIVYIWIIRFGRYVLNVQQIFSSVGFERLENGIRPLHIFTVNLITIKTKNKKFESNLAIFHAFKFQSIFPLIQMQLNVVYRLLPSIRCSIRIYRFNDDEREKFNWIFQERKNRSINQPLFLCGLFIFLVFFT